MINELRTEAQTRTQRAPTTLASDAREAAQIWEEVERVKSEVDLLWGDVGRLRGVVEGGLGVRRARDGGVIGRPADGADVIAGSVIRGNSLRDMSQASDEEEEEDEAPAEEDLQEQQDEEEVQEDRNDWGFPRAPGEPVLSAVLEEDEPASTRASARSPLIHSGRFIQVSFIHPLLMKFS